MFDWKRWVWPAILSTVLLTVLAVWVRVSPVESDLAAKVAHALGKDHWATVRYNARDVVLSGVAPDEEARAETLRQVASAYGVRTVVDETTLADLADPYRFSATKNADGITLSGHFPQRAAHLAVVDAAAAQFPGLKITDAMTLARGAPESYTAQAEFAMEKLAELAHGEAVAQAGSFSLKGTAADIDAYEALVGLGATVLPAGLTAGVIAVEPAPVEGDYVLSAMKDGDAVLLEGFAPTPAARDAMVATMSGQAPGAQVDNRLRIGAGAPQAFPAFAGQALQALAQLRRGRMVLTGSSLQFSGLAADEATKARAEAALKAAPDGLEIASSEIVLPEPPWSWQATTDGNGLALSGAVPDEAAGQRLAARAARMVGPGNVRDAQKPGKGAPDGFEAAAVAAMQALVRMAAGEVAFSSGAVTLKGEARSMTEPDALAASLRAALPEGLSLASSVEPAPAAAAGPLQAEACQQGFDAILGGNRIYFDTGSASLDADSLGMIDRLAGVAIRCTTSAIEVAGHTDSDGDDQQNMALSEARAGAVVEALVRAGVPASRMTAVGYGETAPVAPDDTPENKARNRRIEFRVTGQQEE
ncbi:OmpA family protein [Zhengella mangrovi]|nr:OmpA family protein [Zhengella mangrovi]